jgi:hypothetical protein
MRVLKKLINKLRKKSFIRFTNFIPGVCEIYPIQPSGKIKFNWISKCSNSAESKNTVRCPGINDMMRRGFIITAPFDFTIKTDNKEKFEWKMPVDPNTLTNLNLGNYISYHSKSQLREHTPSRVDSLDIILKINTYWSLIASDDLIFLQMPVPYPDHDLFSAVLGIIDSDKYYSLIIQIDWHKIGETHTIKAGTPLCQLIPIQRNLLVDYSVEEASEDDIKMYQKYSYNVAHRFSKDINHWKLSTKTILDNFRKKINI